MTTPKNEYDRKNEDVLKYDDDIFVGEYNTYSHGIWKFVLYLKMICKKNTENWNVSSAMCASPM